MLLVEATKLISLYLKEELNQETLGTELNSLVKNTINNPEIGKLKGLYKFLDDNFYVLPKKSPSGQTKLKSNWVLFTNEIKRQIEYSELWKEPSNSLGLLPRMFEDLDLPLIIKYFSKGTGYIQPPKKFKLGSNTYLNSAQLNEDKLKEYAEAIELVFKELKGWRKDALDGGVTVDFAPAPKFRSKTVGGRYNRNEGILYVRATPTVLKRTKGTYGAFDYIIVHELGHRFQHIKKTRNFSVFGSRGHDKSWYTSKYSYSDGEAFAELFAIGNFNIKGDWDPEILVEFEKLMQAKDYK